MKKIIPVLSVLLMPVFAGGALAAYDRPFIGEDKIYVADGDDTLVHIAREFEMGFVEMRAANPEIDPWLPGEGAELVVPGKILLPDAPRTGVVINLPEMRIFIYKGDAEPVTFPISIGREGLETPIGSTTVTRKADGPIWRPTPRMRREDPSLPAEVKQGPDNPMGTHALYLGWPSYALHGTNKPYGIGRRASSGCIRLYPEHITQLYDMIPVGTKVTTVNQPIKLAWIDDVLYMEAHPDMDQAIQMEETGQIYYYKMTDADMAQIVKAAGAYQDKLHWATIRNEVRSRSGRPVMIARREGGVMEQERLEVIRGNAGKKSDVVSGEQAQEQLAEIYEGEAAVEAPTEAKQEKKSKDEAVQEDNSSAPEQSSDAAGEAEKAEASDSAEAPVGTPAEKKEKSVNKKYSADVTAREVSADQGEAVQENKSVVNP